MAPTTVEYWPAVQLLHVASPGAILCFPATHFIHGPPSGPVKPAMHVQSVVLLLPVGDVALETQFKHLVWSTDEYVLSEHCVHVTDDGAEIVPGLHSKQFDDPFTALYFPSAHISHGPPSSPVNPATHAQSIMLLLPAGDVALAAHSVHSVLSTDEYVSTEHCAGTNAGSGTPIVVVIRVHTVRAKALCMQMSAYELVNQKRRRLTMLNASTRLRCAKVKRGARQHAQKIAVCNVLETYLPWCVHPAA